MKIILLAAGYGTRLRPLTIKTPKCLVKIKGKPLLSYWLDLLCESNEYPILINTHYLNDKVEDYLNKNRYRHRVTISYEKKLLGTAGTIRANKEFIKEDTVLLIHADNLSAFNLEDFIKKHLNRPKECDITMMLFKTDDPKSCGIVELDENEVVVSFHEKVKSPSTNLANGAVYLIENSVIREISKNMKISDFSTQVIPKYIGRIYTYLNNNYHRDIGTLESLKLANNEYRDYK